jgi:hypothetical protein
MINRLIDGLGAFMKRMFISARNNRLKELAETDEFRSLHKSFGMSEEEFVDKGGKMLRENPKEFQKILKYDVRKSRYGKYFK